MLTFKPASTTIETHRSLCGLLSTMSLAVESSVFPHQQILSNYQTTFPSFCSPTSHPPRLIPVGPVLVDGLNQFTPVTVSDVEHLLSQLNSSKAGGPDGIHPWELNIAAQVIAPPLTSLINTSLASGFLPEEFKSADVTPILKPGKSDMTLPSNYRGISLLTSLPF